MKTKGIIYKEKLDKLGLFYLECWRLRGEAARSIHNSERQERIDSRNFSPGWKYPRPESIALRSKAECLKEICDQVFLNVENAMPGTQCKRWWWKRMQ